MSQQVWINLIKPRKIEQLIGNEDVFSRLFQSLEERPQIKHVLLGPTSVGKRTSLFLHCSRNPSCDMMLVEEPQQINELFASSHCDIRRGKTVVCVIDDEGSVLQDTRRRITDMEKEGLVIVHRFHRISYDQMVSFVMDIVKKLEHISKAHIVLTTQLLDTLCRHSDGKIARAVIAVRLLLDVSSMATSTKGEYPFEEVLDLIARGTSDKKVTASLSDDFIDFAADSLPVPNNLDSLARRNEAMCQYDVTRDMDMLLLSMSQERRGNSNTTTKQKSVPRARLPATVRPDMRQRRDQLLYGPKDSIIPLSPRRLDERETFGIVYRMFNAWMSRNDNVQSLSKGKKVPFPECPDIHNLHGPLSFLDSMWLRRGDANAFYRTRLNSRSAADSFVFADEIEVPKLPSPYILMLLHARKSEHID
jgi:hypothetical protein